MRIPVKKKHSAYLLFALLACAAFLLPSCKNKNTMGSLRGQWQLMQIDYADGAVSTPDNPRRYILFDQGVIQLTVPGDKTLYKIEYAGEVTGDYPDYLFNFPAPEYASSPESIERLAPWGITSAQSRAQVLVLNHKELQLLVDGNTLTLRRF